MSDKNQQVIEIYNTIAHKYAQTFDAVDSEDDLKFPNRFASCLRIGSRVLDLGCGTGFTVNFLSKKGMEAHGVDLSEGMISIAKKQYPNASFAVADMRTYRPQEMFDAVWAGYSLFHFEEKYLKQTIQNIKSYLKPGGIFGLVVQEGTGEVEPQEPFLPEKNIYIHLYKQQEIKSLLLQNDFEIVEADLKKAKEYEFPYDKLLVIARYAKS